MKWLALLLSVFMIVISCIPCADAAPEVSMLAQTTIQEKSDSDNHTPAADLCSPLCICNCCAGFALQITLQKTSLPVFKVITPAPVHQPVALLNPSFSIWQPPRL